MSLCHCFQCKSSFFWFHNEQYISIKGWPVLTHMLFDHKTDLAYKTILAVTSLSVLEVKTMLAKLTDLKL